MKTDCAKIDLELFFKYEKEIDNMKRLMLIFTLIYWAFTSAKAVVERNRSCAFSGEYYQGYPIFSCLMGPSFVADTITGTMVK